MSEYKKILIGLNLSEMDHTTIAYAAMVFSLAGGERLYCMHVTRNLAIPPKIAKAYPTMLRPPDEYAADKILASIKQSAGRKLPDMIDVDVVEGNPLDELLRRAQQKNVDMIIMGRKHNEKETRQLPLKLTRKATCAV
ncbi:MAG: universal stress protein, partial [Calditrichaeota bacterium]|nr:universal stress protein [Calditrichota bacterium]